MDLRIKRVYQNASDSDGYRILVDRIWPRGVSKEAARVDEWLKEVAPSSGLRTWFGHDPERFDEFAERYRAELRDNEAAERLRKTVKENAVVTLVYSAKDTEHNQAVVLRDLLDG